jgi:hypothetical protein
MQSYELIRPMRFYYVLRPGLFQLNIPIDHALVLDRVKHVHKSCNMQIVW